MLFDEDDIDLLSLTDRRFEEACFDLLLSLGYQGLTWRTGGADGGRDIQGRTSIQSPLVGAYDEVWFFECKRHTKGVPPQALNSKIAWADAEKPNHLAILTSSHLTRGAREWLDKVASSKLYTIHVVEGKALRRLFTTQPDTAARYFLDDKRRLVLDARRTWLIHNIIPEPETLAAISRGVDSDKLSAEELAFVWCSAKLRNSEIELLIEDSEPFYFDHMFLPLSRSANSACSVLGTDPDVVELSFSRSAWEQVYNRLIAAQVVLNGTTPTLALYAFVWDSEGEGLEVLIEQTSDFRTAVRHLKQGAHAETMAAARLLSPRGFTEAEALE